MPDTCCYSRCKAVLGNNNRSVAVPKPASEERRRRQFLEAAWEGNVEFEEMMQRGMALDPKGKFPGSYKFCRSHLADGSLRLDPESHLPDDRRVSLSENARALRWCEIEERDRKAEQGKKDEHVTAAPKVSTRRSLIGAFMAAVSPIVSPAKKKTKVSDTPESSPVKDAPSPRPARVKVAAARQKPKPKTLTEMRTYIRKLERQSEQVGSRVCACWYIFGASAHVQ
jgi:hypothetical protein